MSTPTPTIHVRFMLPLSVNFGDHLVLAGASPELGNWDPMAAPKFAWSSPDIWILDAELPASTSTEFKVVHLTASGETIWEYTNNRVIDIPSAETMKDGEVTLAWCDEAAEVARPKILSSLASWDEEDGSAQGGSSMPFGNLFGFLSSADGEEIVGEASVAVDEEIAESEETVEAVAEVMEVEEEEEEEEEDEEEDEEDYYAFLDDDKDGGLGPSFSSPSPSSTSHPSPNHHHQDPTSYYQPSSSTSSSSSPPFPSSSPHSPPPPRPPRKAAEKTLAILLQAMVGKQVLVELKTNAEARGILEEGKHSKRDDRTRRRMGSRLR